MRADSDASPLSDTPTADMEVSPAPELPENDRTSEDKTPSLVSPNDSAVTEDLTTSTSEDRAIDSNSSVQIEQPEEASMQPETPQKMEEEDVEAVKDLNVESDTSDAADTSKSSQDERVLSPGEGEAGTLSLLLHDNFLGFALTTKALLSYFVNNINIYSELFLKWVW